MERNTLEESSIEMSYVLREALHESGVRLDDPAMQNCIDLCKKHFELMLKWNRTHNLTRITDPQEAAHKHYADCLLPLLQIKKPHSVTDIGSGAGFPGMIAAFLWPDVRVALLDVVSKKASFLTLVAGELGLAYVEVNPTHPAGELLICRATFSENQRQPFWELAERHGRIAVWCSLRDLSSWKTQAEQQGFEHQDQISERLSTSTQCLVLCGTRIGEIRRDLRQA